MKKKGFTLIELLAVIVILAIIAIIVTPMIMGTINSVRQSALKSSAQAIVHAAEEYCTKSQIDGSGFKDKSYSLNESTANIIGYSYNSELTGTIAIYSDCKVALAVTNEVYQATKAKTEDNVTTTNKSADYDNYRKSLVIATPESCFTFTKNTTDNTATITIYDVNSCGTDVVIPETLDGATVTSIGEYAFSGDRLCHLLGYWNSVCKQNQAKLTSVDLSNLSKLVSIGEYAFSENTLKSIDLSNQLSLETIGPDGFGNNQFSSLTISNLPKLKTLGKYSFWSYKNDSTYLKIDNLPSLETIDYDAFYGNHFDSLEMTNLPKLTTIGKNSFSLNNFNDLKISNLDSLTTIGMSAFSSCSINTLEISNLPKLTTIDSNAFESNPVKTLTLSNLPSLANINYGAFVRGYYTYPEKTLGADVCSPSYTFDNIPNVAAFNSTDETGLSPYAFGKMGAGCGNSSSSYCDGQANPNVTYKGTVNQVLKDYNYDIIVMYQCE